MGKLSVVVLFLFSLNLMAQTPTLWGSVDCKAVSQKEAQDFANKSHFLDNFDFFRESMDTSPPYVEPVGTLNCSLPIKLWETQVLGQKEYSAWVQLHDYPNTLATCEIVYFDGRPSITFPASGDGHGSVTADPKDTLSSVNMNFSNPRSRALTDDFVAIDITRTPQLLWVPEWTDSRTPKVPLVSRCSVNVNIP